MAQNEGRYWSILYTQKILPKVEGSFATEWITDRWKEAAGRNCCEARSALKAKADESLLRVL